MQMLQSFHEAGQDKQMYFSHHCKTKRLGRGQMELSHQRLGKARQMCLSYLCMTKRFRVKKKGTKIVATSSTETCRSLLATDS